MKNIYQDTVYVKQQQQQQKTNNKTIFLKIDSILCM